MDLDGVLHPEAVHVEDAQARAAGEELGGVDAAEREGEALEPGEGAGGGQGEAAVPDPEVDGGGPREAGQLEGDAAEVVVQAGHLEDEHLRVVLLGGAEQRGHLLGWEI